MSTARILIVEDETALADVISDVLVDEGYSVVRARDGLTALNMLTSGSQPVDLVVCDVMLPGLRGDRLAGELRRLMPHRRLPILLVSASIEPHVRLRDVWFMAKPVDLKALLRTIEHLLEPRKLGAYSSS